MLDTIEDALEWLVRQTGFQDCAWGLMKRDATLWYLSFGNSVVQQIGHGRALSTAQVGFVIKLFKSLIKDRQFAKDHPGEYFRFRQLTEFAVFRQQPTTTVKMRREVRHIGDNVLAFRFNANDQIKAELKLIGTTSPITKVWYDGKHRLWLCTVNVDSLPALLSLIRQYEFQYDEATLRWLVQAKNVESTAMRFFIEEDRIVGHLQNAEIVALWATVVLPGAIL